MVFVHFMEADYTKISIPLKSLLIFSLILIESISTEDNTRRICGYKNGPICCPGWYNNISSPCSIPSCAGNCGDYGRCIRPNTCLCADRRLRFSCDAEEQESMQRDQPSDTCIDDCNRRGKCVGGTCQCDKGFSGITCEKTLESSCFAKLQRGLCVHPVQHKIASLNVTSKMSREMCCNSFGIAWGEPCQPCRITYCGRGYMLQQGSCRDIDECRIPGVCQNGKCMNIEGSYTCKCPDGYEFDAETLQCKNQKGVCDLYGRQCSPGGKCIPLSENDFKCICKWGYVSTRGQKSCIPKKEISFDICSLYSKSICKNGVCIPRGNSYECQCNEGFEASVDRKSCFHKIDVCTIHRGYLCQHGDCVPTGRDFYCLCDPGYTPSFDRRRCLNQCEQLGPNICPNGQCIPLPYGDYECLCFPGFESTMNRKHCIPDETSLLFEVPPNIPYANDEALNPTRYQPVSSTSYYHAKDSKLVKPGGMYNSPSYRTQPDRKQYLWQKSHNNPCSQPHIYQRCHGGTCLNLGGQAYSCECLAGFESYDRGRYCAKRT